MTVKNKSPRVYIAIYNHNGPKGREYARWTDIKRFNSHKDYIKFCRELYENEGELYGVWDYLMRFDGHELEYQDLKELFCSELYENERWEILALDNTQIEIINSFIQKCLGIDFYAGTGCARIRPVAR